MAIVKRQPEKNIYYVENFYNHIFKNNFLSSKSQIHDLEKYPLTKQTHSTHIEEPNTLTMYILA